MHVVLIGGILGGFIFGLITGIPLGFLQSKLIIAKSQSY